MILGLVKPQFELERRSVGKGGVVRDPALRRRAIQRICAFAGNSGWGVVAVVPSVLAGADGNREFFVQLAPDRAGVEGAKLAKLIDAAIHETEELP
jgi:23S rRNA (cytidine1920-2'-O)/16S rRNA (cytidine1409-2'-O)-methyltransferase